jgi:hypothetical protein
MLLDPRDPIAAGEAVAAIPCCTSSNSSNSTARHTSSQASEIAYRKRVSKR